MTWQEVLVTAALGLSSWIFGPIVGAGSFYLAAIHVGPLLSKVRARLDGGAFSSGARFLVPMAVGWLAAAGAGIGIPALIAGLWRGPGYALLVASVAAASLAAPYALFLPRHH